MCYIMTRNLLSAPRPNNVSFWLAEASWSQACRKYDRTTQCLVPFSGNHGYSRNLRHSISRELTLHWKLRRYGNVNFHSAILTSACLVWNLGEHNIGHEHPGPWCGVQVSQMWAERTNLLHHKIWLHFIWTLSHVSLKYFVWPPSVIFSSQLI